MQNRNRTKREQLHSEGDIVYGRRPVEELLRAHPDQVGRLYLLRGASGSRELLRLVREMGVRGGVVSDVPREALDRLAQSKPHQGVVARLVGEQRVSMTEVFSQATAHDRSGRLASTGLVVALDEIGDPQNLGAVLRVADGVGADGVLLTRRRSAPLSAVARKASAGANAWLRLCWVSNLSQALRAARARGLWIVGTAGDKGVVSLYEAVLSRPAVVVLGSEAQGLRRLTRTLCDEVVSVPMRGGVGSLNVSQAASVVLYELMRRWGMVKHKQ